MGIDLKQLVSSAGISKGYTDTEITEAEKRISALIQALYEVVENNREDPIHVLHENVGLQDTPVGHVMAYMGTTAPHHYLVCDGAEYEIAAFPALSQHILKQFGSVNYFGGDGVDTFCVPDLRDNFLRGYHGDNDGQLSGEIGVQQKPTSHPALYTNNAGTTLLTGKSTTSSTKTGIYDTDTKEIRAQLVSVGVSTSTSNGDVASTYTSRPMNVAVLYCIKYEPTFYLRAGSDTDYYAPYGEEVCIGTAPDGRPRYRKTLLCTCQANTNIDPGVENLDNIINIYGGLIEQNGAGMTPLGFHNGTNFISVFYNGSLKMLSIRCHSTYNGSTLEVTFEYVKKTETD